ncbi:MAG: NAD(P)/FAD-dependent oxidoreductase [Actinomycetota bacterium]
MSDSALITELHDVIVVGAGAAGIGISVALTHADITDFIVLDREAPGASFAKWPAETRFITPSFPTNSIGMLDLNSVALGTSPAVTLRAEHPTGLEYAAYIQLLAEFFEVPVSGNTDVLGVEKVDDEFHVRIAEGIIRAKHVIWAAGEFQYPNLDGIPGAEHCVHTATVESYDELEGDEFIIIGGYESGIDAAYHLAKRGKKVTLFDSGCPWKSETSDPSVALSTYSMERMEDQAFIDNVEVQPYTKVAAVQRSGDGFAVASMDGVLFDCDNAPLFAGGFLGSHQMVAHLFEEREDGFPHLSDDDESTITPGLFLCGPAVRHGNMSFCFIYKYRQRFAVVAKKIATSLGIPAEDLEVYREWGMYLDDLSCCGEECVC